MKFKATAAIHNWYGISANEGDKVEIPDGLSAKAEKAEIWERVKAGRPKNAENVE